MRAVVVGSLNLDLVLAAPELPSPGQTLLSRSAVPAAGFARRRDRTRAG